MKKLIRAAESYSGTIGRYGSNNVASTRVDVFGKVIGDAEVFYVNIENKKDGYFCGGAPKNSDISWFRPFCIDIQTSLGIQVDADDSDEYIVDSVNNKLLDMIEDPRSEALFEYFNEDPVKLHWKFWDQGGDSIDLQDASSRSLFESSKDFTHFVPSFACVYQIVESGDLEVCKQLGIDIRNYELYEVKQAIKEAKKREKLINTPYPYNASDEVVESVHDLQKFINKIPYDMDLEEAEEYLRSISVENKNTNRYHDPESEKHLSVIFEWADENNMDVPELKRSVKQVYKLYLAKP